MSAWKGWSASADEIARLREEVKLLRNAYNGTLEELNRLQDERDEARLEAQRYKKLALRYADYL